MVCECVWLDYLKLLFVEFGVELLVCLNNIYLSFFEDLILLLMLLEEWLVVVSFYFGVLFCD